ncbi:MAG: hypothetical protein Q9227_003951 [Pyrenula ochraceoflavens]
MFTVKIQPPPGPDLKDRQLWQTDQSLRVFSDAMLVREEVFCVEQGCSFENELDEDDPKSWQWVFYQDEAPVSVVRLTPPPHPPHPNGHRDKQEEPYVKVSRIAVMSAVRGQGFGRRAPEEALAWAASHAEEIGNGWKGMVLVHAQLSVEKMYAKMGFTTDEKLGQWDEEGIVHVGMWKRVVLNPPKNLSD